MIQKVCGIVIAESRETRRMEALLGRWDSKASAAPLEPKRRAETSSQCKVETLILAIEY